MNYFVNMNEMGEGGSGCQVTEYTSYFYTKLEAFSFVLLRSSYGVPNC